MYYIAVNLDDVALICTCRKEAAHWVGVSAKTITRHLRTKGKYRSKKGFVYVTDFIKRQKRGFSLKKRTIKKP
jgi:hypothetical protein